MRSIFIRTSALLSVLANDIQTSTDGKAGARMTDDRDDRDDRDDS